RPGGTGRTAAAARGACLAVPRARSRARSSRSSRHSAAGEARRATLGCGERPFAHVVGPDEDALGEELHLEEGLLVGSVAEVDQLLREPDRERRVGGDLPGEPRGGGEMIARRHDLVHEAERKRLRSRDHAARHDELLRLRIADGADEPGRAAHVGDEPEPDLGQAELAVAGRDPQVERERELESESGHVAMERADDGLLDRLEARQRRLHLAYDRAEGRARLALDVGREHAEIDASREHPPLAVDDHGPYIPVALGGGHRVDEGKEHLAVDGGPPLGPVQADVGGRVLAAPAGMEPRRLVGANGVLFVGELDRVEAFKIGPHGALTPMAATKTITSPAMEVIDMAVAADGQTLYVAQNGPDRIAAYPIAAATSRSWDFTSCIQGRVNGSYRALHIRNGLLYASEQLSPGRIAIFPINAGGSLHDLAECTTPTGKTRPEATPAISDQQRIQRPRSFVFLDDRVYVDEVG